MKDHAKNHHSPSGRKETNEERFYLSIKDKPVKPSISKTQ
jgi:hypothetical protein